MDSHLDDKMKRLGFEIPPDLWPYVEGYVKRREEDITLMKSLFFQRNFSGVRDIAHRLKGHGLSFGFPTLTSGAERLQRSLQEENYSMAEEVLQDLHHEVLRAKHGLNLN